MQLTGPLCGLLPISSQLFLSYLKIMRRDFSGNSNRLRIDHEKQEAGGGEKASLLVFGAKYSRHELVKRLIALIALRL